MRGAKRVSLTSLANPLLVLNQTAVAATTAATGASTQVAVSKRHGQKINENIDAPDFMDLPSSYETTLPPVCGLLVLFTIGCRHGSCGGCCLHRCFCDSCEYPHPIQLRRQLCPSAMFSFHRTEGGLSGAADARIASGPIGSRGQERRLSSNVSRCLQCPYW